MSSADVFVAVRWPSRTTTCDRAISVLGGCAVAASRTTPVMYVKREDLLRERTAMEWLVSPAQSLCLLAVLGARLVPAVILAARNFRLMSEAGGVSPTNVHAPPRHLRDSVTVTAAALAEWSRVP